MIEDLSDEGLVARFGDVMHEMPELYLAIRRFELQRRQTRLEGGYRMRGDGLSVKRDAGDVTRICVGNAER